MRELTVWKIEPSGELRSALMSAGLPVADIGEPGRHFYECRDAEATMIGFSGLEECGSDFLLRSTVILPDFRSQGFGRELVTATISQTSSTGDIYLVTTAAAGFFERLGFRGVARDCLPQAILSTRQLSGLCPASATIMKLERPST